MQFPEQVVTEITVPNNVPFQPGYDVIGIGTQLPPAVIANGYPAAIMFYSSSYNPTLTVPQIKYQFIADKGGTIYFGYGYVANASVSQAETIVTYEGHGFTDTSAQSQFSNISAQVITGSQESIDALAANTSLLYRGTELQTLLDALQAQISGNSLTGIVSYGNLPASGNGPYVCATGARAGMFYIGANVIANRIYRLRMTPMGIQCSAANVNMGFFISFTSDGTQPALVTGGSTTILYAKSQAVASAVDNFDWTVEFVTPSNAQYNFLFGLDNNVTNHGAGNASATILGSVTVTVEDIGPAQALNNLHAAFSPPPVTPTNYTVSQRATSSRSFTGGGSQVNSGQEMYTGQSPYGPNGQQYSDFFFAGSGVNTLGYLKTTNATAGGLKYMRLQLQIRHWYYSGGGILRFGWSDSGGYHFLTDRSVGAAPSVIVFDLVGSAIQTVILAGTFQAFNIGGAAGNLCPPGNYNYYGYSDGASQANPPLFTAGWAV